MRWSLRRAGAAALLLVGLLAGCAAPRPAAPFDVKVLALNDFHGNLMPPVGGIRVRDPRDAARLMAVDAGGAEHLATAVAQAKAKNPEHVFVAAGDLIGASPLLSALFHDEPTIDALSLMGLELSAVGNHEFDKGRDELLRMQNGGCHPQQGCRFAPSFAGAKFRYLSASTFDRTSGRTLFPAYQVKRFRGVPVAFVGLTLKDTPNLVVPAGVAALEFRDEAQTVNALVPEIRGQGIEAIVVLIHEGGYPTGDYDECPGISGPIVDIVRRLDPAVKLVVSGHTHRAYVCRIDGRLVTSADKYGTVLTEIDMTLDPATGGVAALKAHNLLVRTDAFAKDPAQTALVASARERVLPLARRPVGRLVAPLTRDLSPAGENTLGQVIADAQLAATAAPADGGAQLALMNPGGIRADLKPREGGVLTYEDLFTVQPFYNNLVTMTLTGAQLVQVLEEQWIRQPIPKVMQVSRGFAYAWDPARPVGQRVVAGSLRLNGQPVMPDSQVRVTVNHFMASGGDGFVTLREGRDARTGIMDIDALERWVAAQGALAPGALDRIALRTQP